jgi:hypothetical protein
MAKKLIPYINRFNGDVKIVSKQSAKKLSEDYSKVQFTENEQGKRVMRFELEGATVDVLENEQPAELEASDGNRDTE